MRRAVVERRHGGCSGARAPSISEPVSTASFRRLRQRAPVRLADGGHRRRDGLPPGAAAAGRRRYPVAGPTSPAAPLRRRPLRRAPARRADRLPRRALLLVVLARRDGQ